MTGTEEDDPVVREVRERAMRISERFGHDSRKYFEHLKRLQERDRHLIVNQVSVVRSSSKDNG